MPSGYTADIYDGKPGAVSAQNFLWQVVRAFGVCIEQRDDRQDAAIKLPAVGSYHTDRLIDVQEELRELSNRSDEDWQRLYDAFLLNAQIDHDESARKAEGVHQRISTVRDEILGLEFPEELLSLRKYALEQLDQTDEHDGKVSSYYVGKASLSFEEWKAESIRSANWSVQYHIDGFIKDMQNTCDRMDYLTKLIRLIGLPPQGTK